MDTRRPVLACCWLSVAGLILPAAGSLSTPLVTENGTVQSVDSECTRAAAELPPEAEQLRQQHRRSLQRQLIADLESPRRHNRNRYPAIAELLNREAAAVGKLFQYIDLIWRLGASDVSERIEPQVAQALRDVWGLR